MKRILTVLLVALFLLPSCMKMQRDTLFASQEEKIDKYVTSRLNSNSSYTVDYLSKSTRINIAEGSGDSLGSKGTLSFHYALYVFTGSNPSSSSLVATNHEATAKNAGFSTEQDDIALLTVDLADSGFVEGLKDGLVGVRGGGEYEIIFSGKYGFGSTKFGTIPANSALLYKIWVGAVSN